MEINITNKEGITLKTENTVVKEDIKLTIDGSILGGSGLTINGIIEQYKVQAGKTVNAGDFVEFVNAVIWGSANFNSGSSSYISVCKLNDSSVLVAYADGSSYYGTAIVLTIDGTTITVGTEKVFNSANTTHISAVALNETKVLVAYYNSSQYYGIAQILTVSGTTITGVASKTFNSGDSSSYISVCKLNENTALVAYFTSNTGSAQILSIDGTTITVGTKKVFNSANTSYISAVALNESKVLVAYCDEGNSDYGTAMILSIDGTTISVGTETVFNSANTGLHMSVVKLSENKVLVAYYSSSKGCAQVLTIDGTTISVGTETVFNSLSAGYISCIVFSSSSAVVFYNNNSRNGTYKGLSINGNEITANTTTQNETLVLPSETVINGVANTSGTASETVEVYVPN